MKKLSKTIVFILLSLTAQCKELSRKSQEIYTLINESKIPEQIKEMYFRVTLIESGWHESENASRHNNFSGFMAKTKKGYRLIHFKSVESWIAYSERFFERKNIEQENEFLKFIRRGKYCARKKVATYIRILNLLTYERINEERTLHEYSVCARRTAGIYNSYSH